MGVESEDRIYLFSDDGGEVGGYGLGEGERNSAGWICFSGGRVKMVEPLGQSPGRGNVLLLLTNDGGITFAIDGREAVLAGAATEDELVNQLQVVPGMELIDAKKGDGGESEDGFWQLLLQVDQRRMTEQKGLTIRVKNGDDEVVYGMKVGKARLVVDGAG